MKRLTNQKIAWWVKIIIHLLLLFGIYLSSYRTMVGQWQRDDYNYCYLVPFIILYLLWEKKGSLARTASRPSWAGFAPLLVGVFLFWLGELGGEFYTIYLSSWFVLLGLCWMHLGWKKLKVIAFPIFFVLTMFPPPNFVYNKISVMLKLISSQLGVAMMQAFGMSAYREGNVIDLGFTQLQVVDACSGLRYLIPLIVLGLLLAYFFKAAFWKRTVVVISTVPLSIITNSLRIAATGILYEFWGPEVAEGFFHGFSGWLIFMISLGVLLIEMWILKSIGRPSSHTESPAPPSGAAGQARTATLFSPRFVVGAVVLAVTLALSQGIEFRERIPINKPFDQFPLQVGQWVGKRLVMEQRFIDALDLTDYVMIDYRDKAGRSIDFYAAYYESQRKGESIHTPATCLPGSGWIFKDAGTVEIPVAFRGGDSMPVNRAFMEKGGGRQLVYYFFLARGRILTNVYELKFFTFWDALTRQRTDGALVRFITPVNELDKEGEADERLQRFAREIVPALEEYVPGDK